MQTTTKKKEMNQLALDKLNLNYVVVTRAVPYKGRGLCLDFNWRGTQFIHPVEEPGWYGVTRIVNGNLEVKRLVDYR